MPDDPTPEVHPLDPSRSPEHAWHESRQQQAWVLTYAARKVFFLMLVGVFASIVAAWWIGHGG